jgi:hypothetical protein
MHYISNHYNSPKRPSPCPATPSIGLTTRRRSLGGTVPSRHDRYITHDGGRESTPRRHARGVGMSLFCGTILFPVSISVRKSEESGLGRGRFQRTWKQHRLWVVMQMALPIFHR